MTRPLFRTMLYLCWAFLSLVIVLTGFLEYAYTLSFGQTVLDGLLVNRMRLNQTEVVLLNTTEVVRFSGAV